LVIYAFSFAIIAHAQSSTQELHNASIGFVDEDNSELSRRISHAFLPPYYKPPQPVDLRDVDQLMNTGKFTFIVDIPQTSHRRTRLRLGIPCFAGKYREILPVEVVMAIQPARQRTNSERSLRLRIFAD
jgi:hypothetical protein